MIIQPWSPDPDKYADECKPCLGAGIIALNGWINDYPFWRQTVENVVCEDCLGTGITVDWTLVEPALLGGRQ